MASSPSGPRSPRAVEAAGLVFVGPTAGAIAALGDKLAARRAAPGRPACRSFPGTLEPVAVDRPDRLEAIVAEAERIGFPLLVKAAAGGGGRGMRRVDAAEDLPAALAAGVGRGAPRRSATASSTSSGRSGRRATSRSSCSATRTGRVVALGERDCSIQRRHQKLVEESPAPGPDRGERRELHAMAVRVASAAGLHNAATAEFLRDPDGRFWFLEVNARLQVEHGVTELVTGLDLVAEQFCLAAGGPLSAAALAAAAPGRRADRPRDRGPPLGRGPGPRLRPGARPGRPLGDAGRPGRPGRHGARGGGAGPARLRPARSPSSWSTPRTGRRRSPGSGAPSTRSRSAGSRRPCRSTGSSSAIAAFAAGELSTDWVDEHWDGAGRSGEAVRVALVAAGLGRARGGRPAGTHRPAGGRARPPARAGRPVGWRLDGRETALDRWPR